VKGVGVSSCCRKKGGENRRTPLSCAEVFSSPPTTLLGGTCPGLFAQASLALRSSSLMSTIPPLASTSFASKPSGTPCCCC
jgi:hypothetical protein